MLVVSLFSVCAGGSLGPEAPLLTLCASLVGFIYKEVVVTKKKLLRQFSLMGMGAGLAAFFGASMGGMHSPAASLLPATVRNTHR